ncbi:MAG: response regulator [Methanoregula sp.]|nr:response regulator [Methanoregula sp.]
MIHVLYVDDEPDLLELGKLFLEQSGTMAVETATSARQALEMLEHFPYDAVVSDFQMPEMDGISFLKCIRSRSSDLPFILFTGKGREEVVIEALNNGADFYLQKGGDSKSQFIELHHKIIQSVKSRESEEKFRILVEESLVGVYIIQGDRFLHVNPRFAGIFGYSQNEIITSIRVQDLVSDEDRAMVTGNLRKRFSGDVKSLHYRFKGRRNDGGVIDVEVTGTRTLFHGQPIVVGTLVDVNDHHLAGKNLILANRKLSLLNNLTRHDIANRLTVLRGRLKIVRNQYKDPGLQEHLKKIDDAGGEIYHYLETARIYQEIGSEIPQWQNVQEIITRELDRLAISSLHATVMVAGLEIHADPLCNRVFTNLIDNTIRHGIHATEIRVSFRRSDYGVTIFWEDNGIGIPADLKEKIFEQGFGSNTGIGLYLCREILSDTGITIRENGIPGKGARFEITIPEHAWQISGNSLGRVRNPQMEQLNT